MASFARVADQKRGSEPRLIGYLPCKISHLSPFARLLKQAGTPHTSHNSGTTRWIDDVRLSMIIIRWVTLKNQVPLSRSQIWRLEKAGKFPRRIKLSDNAVGWDTAEVEQWLEERKGVAQWHPQKKRQPPQRNCLPKSSNRIIAQERWQKNYWVQWFCNHSLRLIFHFPFMRSFHPMGALSWRLAAKAGALKASGMHWMTSA